MKLVDAPGVDRNAVMDRLQINDINEQYMTV